MGQYGQTVDVNELHKNLISFSLPENLKMFLDFTPIEDELEPAETLINWSEPPKQKIKLTIPPPWRRSESKWSLWEQFFYCLCGHMHAGDICYAEQPIKCSCTKLEYGEADMEIVFTTADIFEIENPNHSENDSPQWWIEFGEWYEKRKLSSDN